MAYRSGAVFILAGVVATPQQVAASDVGEARTSSVYELRPVLDAAILLSSVVAITTPYAFTSQLIKPKCPCSPESVNTFDRGVIGNASDTADWISTVTVGLILVAPPIIDSIAIDSTKSALEDTAVFLEGIAVNGVLVTGAKYIFQRPIPRVYSQPGAAQSPSNYRSFYSGHTSMAFAALSVASVTVDRRYGLSWEPWVVSGALGISVATERVLAGKHFYSDVAVGAAVGTIAGSTVAWLHLRHQSTAITPWVPPSRDGIGLTLSGGF